MDNRRKRRSNIASLRKKVRRKNADRRKMHELRMKFLARFEYIDNAQLMEWFHISSKTARRWVKNGLLRCARIGGRLYYKISDINDMMAEHFQRH